MSSNVAALLGTRQVSPASVRGGETAACVAARLPYSLKEHPLNGVENYDKFFACSWLTPSTVLAVTKCNSLVEWDVVQGAPRTITLPLGRPKPNDSCGMHALAMNQSKTLLCVGGSHPADGLLLDLPTYRPLIRLEGHQDWIFGVSFLKNDTLATCGRDSAIALWSLRDLPGNVLDAPVVRNPALIRREHRVKVRSLHFMECYQQLATLSVDGALKLWDTQNMDVVNTMRLTEAEELIAMAFDPDKRVLAIGSQYHVSFVDPRASVPISTVTRLDTWGVRSLSFKHNLLTVGGGSGTLVFFDMRVQGEPIALAGQGQELHTGRGWMRKDANYYAQLSRGPEPPNCVYTHAWNESGSSLFVAGGPLLVGLRGSYAAMWM